MDLERSVGRPRLVRLALLTMLLAVAGCAGARSSAPPGDTLRTMSLAARASEFYCEFGRWPEGPAELETFALPEPSRVWPAPSREPIPWLLLQDAEFRREADETLRISAKLPPGSVEDSPPLQPVDLSLQIQVPGCWPPVAVSGP